MQVHFNCLFASTTPEIVYQFRWQCSVSSPVIILSGFWF